MNVCLITPTPLLKSLATKSTTHLVLAHQYLEDPDYAEFYNTRSEAGDFIMLDNSAYELGESMDVHLLYGIAKMLKPDAIFLPDKRFDSKRTLELVVEAIEVLKPLGVKLFAVPQGSDLNEVVLCYEELCRLDIDGFGIYEEIGEVTGLGRRWDFLHYLESYDMVQHDKYYHMLGMEEDLQNISQLAKYGFANSIDSVKPIAYGMYGIQMDSKKGALVPYPHRPKDYFERDFGEFEDVINRNCDLVINWAQKSGVN